MDIFARSCMSQSHWPFTYFVTNKRIFMKLCRFQSYMPSGWFFLSTLLFLFFSSKSLQCHSIFQCWYDSCLKKNCSEASSSSKNTRFSYFLLSFYLKLLLKIVSRTNYLLMLLVSYDYAHPFYLYKTKYFSPSGRLSCSFTYMVNWKTCLHIFQLEVSLNYKLLALTA